MEKKSVSRRSFIKKSTLGLAASTLLPTILSVDKAFAAKSKRDYKMFCYQCEQTVGEIGRAHV